MVPFANTRSIVSGLPAAALEEVAVAIKHHAGPRMTVAFRYEQGVGALFDQERVRRVAQRVEGHFRQFGLDQQPSRSSASWRMIVTIPAFKSTQSTTAQRARSPLADGGPDTGAQAA